MTEQPPERSESEGGNNTKNNTQPEENPAKLAFAELARRLLQVGSLELKFEEKKWNEERSRERS